MKITRSTTIEEMIDKFNLVTMKVTDGKYTVFYTSDGSFEDGKETIRLEGVNGSWIEKAQFGPETKRDVLIVHRLSDPLEINIQFTGSNFPESLSVGDTIACLCSRVSDDPWIVTYWLPYNTYIRYLERLKQRYTR